MTLPSVIRIFFAIDLPPSTKELLNLLLKMLKNQAKTNAIRWAKPENLHITLQFLAEVQTEHLPHLLENVRKEVALAKAAPTLQIGDLLIFPSPHRPRVIVLDLIEQEELIKLAKAIGRGIEGTSYSIDKRPFHGHLTLGRIKHPKVKLQFLADVSLPKIPILKIEEVILFRSEPEHKGSKYTTLEKIRLI